MKIALIVAVSENNVIGVGNKLPWNLPRELTHFRAVTKGHHIIMGRKTHESIGRSLPDRVNVVITRQENFVPFKDAVVTRTLGDAFQRAKEAGETEAIVIGGTQIYDEAMPMVDKMYFTRVHHTFDGDSFLSIDWSKWEEKSAQFFEKDNSNIYDYTMYVYERKLPPN